MGVRRAVRPLAALFIAIALLAATACGSTEPKNLVESVRSGSVVLGTKFDQPGLGLRNPGGAVTGFDPSVSTYVVNHIATELGVAQPEIRWVETPSAQRETLINNGEVDTIAATYSITNARMQRVDFAGPYLVTYQGLLVREDSDITQLSDLSGRKLCSVTGSTPAQNVKTLLPDVQLQEYDSYSSCVEALRRDRLDAMTTDEVILAGYANFFPGEFRLVSMTYPERTCVNGTLRSAGEPFSTEYYGIGMPKEYPESVQQVNEALRAMLTPGTDGTSAWETALRDAIGDEQVDLMISRADEPDSQYRFTPDPGDLGFLDAPKEACDG